MLLLWWNPMIIQAKWHGPLAIYVKLWAAHAPIMPGTFSPSPRVSDPDMHHGTCLTHVPWCMLGSLTSGFLWSRWQGKRSRHSRRMRNPQFYLSIYLSYTSSVIGRIYNGSVIQCWRGCTPSRSIGECAVPDLNAILCFIWFTNCVLLFDHNLILGCLWHCVFV